MSVPLREDLFQKYSKDAAYVIQCDTCGQVFLKTTLEGYAKLIGKSWKYFSDPKHLTGFTFYKFKMYQEYLDACKHWVEHMDHEVNAYVKEKRDDTLNMDLVLTISKDLNLGLIKERPENRSKEVLLSDLNILEREMKRRRI